MPETRLKMKMGTRTETISIVVCAEVGPGSPLPMRWKTSRVTVAQGPS